MAASIVITAGTSRDARGLAARAAARSAPRGPGLATVVALRIPGTPGARVTTPAVPEEPAVTLRVAPPLARHARGGLRIGALVVAVALAALVVGGAGEVARSALDGSAEPAAAGHVVLQPGETLWDVAVRSAPVGVDPRRQLETLRRLNGFGPGALDAWTVVLIPAV
jgi:hypothetical protein